MFSFFESVLLNLPVILLKVLSVCVVLAIAAYLIEPKKGFCKCTEKLNGKTVLVTGGNSGIGLETARDLARKGARVIIASSNVKKSAEAVEYIKATTGNNDVAYKHLDLASFDSVKQFAKDFNNSYDRLDILVNNAGTYGLENKLTPDGIDIVTQINYFGPFLLTNLLLPKLIASKPSRIIIVSSFLHHITFNFDVHTIRALHNSLLNNHVSRYCHSKLCQVLWMKALAKRLPEGVTVNSVHPGAVNTGIFSKAPTARFFLQSVLRLIFKTPTEGAQTLIHVAVAKELENVSGQHYSECTPAKISYKVKDELIEEVWHESVKITNSQFDIKENL